MTDFSLIHHKLILKSSAVTLDLDGAEKRGWRAKDLCAGEVGGEGAVSMREATFRPTLAR